MVYVNQYDKNKNCSEIGARAEDLFKNLAESTGWIVEPATKDQNMHGHIDFLISHPEIGHRSVDVKSRKRKFRNSASFDDEWVWLEFTNVIGNKGWLRGEASHIALEMEHKFILIERLKLFEWSKSIIMEKNGGKAPSTSDPMDSAYKLYTRKGRKDVLTKVKYTDIINGINSIETWNKKK